MPTDVTNSRWRSSNGASLTNTVAGTPGSPVSATRARPVVPELRSSTSAPVTSRPSTEANHSAVRSATSSGSTGARLRAAANFCARGPSSQHAEQSAGRARAASRRHGDRGVLRDGRRARSRSSAKVRRCSRCATSASTRRSAVGSTSAATTWRASRSASRCDRTASASWSRRTTPTSIRSVARSCTSPAGSSTASCRRTRSRRSRWCPKDVDLLDVLGILGHVGITAYVGMIEVAKPQAGEVFCVSAAASSVGSVAGQIAKMKGASRHRDRGLAREVRVGRRRARLRRVHRLQARRRRGAAQGARAQGRRHLLRQRRRRVARHGVASARHAGAHRAVR